MSLLSKTTLLDLVLSANEEAFLFLSGVDEDPKRWPLIDVFFKLRKSHFHGRLLPFVSIITPMWPFAIWSLKAIRINIPG